MAYCPPPAPEVFIPDLRVARLGVTCSLSAPEGVTGLVTGAENVGGGAGEIFSALTPGGGLQLRTLGAGAGITVGTSGELVTISAAGASIVNPAIGLGATAAPGGAAYGEGTTAGADGALAAGKDAAASAAGAAALGAGSAASAPGATALGAGAVARVGGAVNLAGLPFIRNTTGVVLADAARFWAGAEAVVATGLIDLAAPPAAYTIAIPAGANFLPTRFTVVGNLPGWPGAPATPASVRLGNGDDDAAYLAASPFTGVSRHYATLEGCAQAKFLVATVVAPASSEAQCRFVWHGVVLEQEV